jgi:AraC family transcriptional regulator
MASSEQAAQQAESNLSPRFENGKAMTIAGLRGHFTFSDWQGIPAQWTNFMSRGPLPNETGDAHYGLCFGAPNGFDYLSGVEVSSLEGLPADLQHSNVPAQRYAVFTHNEHVSRLRNTLDMIWRKWLPTSGYQANPGTNGAPDFFERYGKNFNPQTGTGDIEVWLPVKS